MGCEVSCFGKTFSTKKRRRENNQNQANVQVANEPITWNGKREYGYKHGYGTEYDTKNDITAYGAYHYDQRIGIWEYKHGAILKTIHEYKDNTLYKVIDFNDGHPKEVYLNENLKTDTNKTGTKGKEVAEAVKEKEVSETVKEKEVNAVEKEVSESFKEKVISEAVKEKEDKEKEVKEDVPSKHISFAE